MSGGLGRLFHNKYVDRFAWICLPPEFHSFFKLLRHGTYDSERVSMMHRAALWLSVNGIQGAVGEFGCAGGESFLNLYFQFAKMVSPVPHFFLFDSFEGLPEMDDKTAHAGWEKGAYRVSEEMFVRRMDFFGISRKSYSLTKGFYQESLSPERDVALGLGPLALVHIDCDLYESTVLALEFVADHLQDGTVLLFDDYYCSKANLSLGESGAYRQWLSQHQKWVSVPWYDYSIHGKAFILSRKT